MPKLSDPLVIKNMELKNRIVMPPMANDFSGPEGEVNDRHLEHYRRRAEAEVALMIVEHSYVTPEGKLSARQLGIYDDSLVSGLSILAEAIRGAGAKSTIQLTHAGASTTDEICGCQPVGPSDVAVPGRGAIPRPLGIDEIKDLTRAHREGARRAKEAGFDSIEIHGAHGFLLNQFVSPYTNRRTDQYGGTTGNRLRLTLEVIAAVREEVGPGYPLFYRFGASDFMEGGLAIDEARLIAPMLTEAGIDVLDVSGGLCGSRPKEFAGVPGFFVPLAQSIKEVVDVPVIAVGGIVEAAFANSVIEEGKADLVAVGRALLKNPDWARQALQELKGNA
ncbi:MAG: NADH:flavin oxidoreductase [Thermoleophilia bacterium]|nr:NADH:flavin oxidoreductase [Thermoleophilia bacterium]